MPTVLHVTNAGGWGRVQHGGAERCVTELSAFVRRELGWDVHVAAPAEFLSRLALADGVAAHAVELGAGGPLAVARLVRRLRPTVLISHLLRSTLVAQPVAAALGVPARVSVLHNSLHKTFSDPPSTRERAYARAFSLVTRSMTHATVAISPTNARDLVRLDGIPEDKVRVIDNWVPPSFHGLDPSAHRAARREELGIADSTPVVGVVGRLEAQKRQDFLIGLMPELSGATLLLLGTGSLGPSYEAQARGLGLDGRVRFLGFQQEVESWMAACDVVAVPSSFEGFGRVAVEALALGLPVVGSDVDGLADVLRGAPEAGRWLVAPSDRGAWITALSNAFDAARDEGLRGELSAFALRRFSLAAAAGEYVRLFRELAGV